MWVRVNENWRNRQSTCAGSLRRVREVERRMRLILRESHIEKAATDYLCLDGWRSIKMEQNFSEKKRKTVGELGMADHLYIRYQGRHNRDFASDLPNWPRAEAEVLFVEYKSASGKLKPAQLQWAAAERARGALVWLSTVDFPPTIEGFQQHYRDSGLARNVR